MNLVLTSKLMLSGIYILVENSPEILLIDAFDVCFEEEIANDLIPSVTDKLKPDIEMRIILSLPSR